MEAEPTSTTPPTCPGCVARDREIAALKDRVTALEALARGQKRQAAPFSKGPPAPDPKRPGRKPGDNYGTKAFRSVPPVIDETYEAPLPERCPRCGGGVELSHVDQQYQVEIPRRPIYRQFNVAVGQCTCCAKRVQGRHPLQTSDALGCCASQIGPEAQAAVVLLNKDLGLSQGKISRFFAAFFRIKLSRGGSCQIMLRSADRLTENYQAIVQRVQASPWIVPDETGWRIGGLLAWLHVAVSQDAVARHLWNHQDQLFTFLQFPRIDATNWRAEQAIRPAVVNRKVWGGNRTAAGAQAQGVLMSVLGTARLLKVGTLEFVAKVLRALPGHRPLLLPAATG